ncbi:MAG: D-aminoacyl-tRNA deacylase [Woeseiaceae bacterium]|jgi:D-aminoacyl-tRNA deacylase|nr:D-tyrosyl-tRNA(Tyr) deacylase [Gammaproteobacteria bacterium]MDG2288539.1 D-aminoacyl-tRNA deacylase [Woeseiaceae bacterium]|tara:strand:- start:152 stop:589 length:438 start_codon:yes stop_codon:yes gene_type:complete
MIGLLQRVTQASVSINDELIGQIGRGLLVLLAVHRDDEERDIARMAERILSYRVFPDAEERMNLSVSDISGELLLVPQFTLTADTQKGTRASFTKGAPPDRASRYFDRLLEECQQSLKVVESGRFAADMQVSLVNDGPVTFWLET